MHSKTFLHALAGVSLITLTLSVAPAHAGGVVGNGTPASCTEAAFDAARAGGGVVTFNCGSNPVTITLSAMKPIQANTTVDGAGLITLTGSNAGVYFQVFSDQVLTLTHLTLSGFSYVQGGALQNFGTLNLIDTTLGNNQNAGLGGSVYNVGRLNVVNSRFLSNKAANEGGAIYNSGGTVNVQDSTFMSNTVSLALGNGGAIANASGVMTITHSSFSGNTSLNGGALSISAGAIAIVDSAQLVSNTAGYGGAVQNHGTLTVTHSTLSYNQATVGDGGAMTNQNGKVLIRNSTLSNNQANSTGGGISHYSNSLVLDKVTLSGNTSVGNGGGIYSNASMNLTNVTLSGNEVTNIGAGGGGVYQNAGTASLHHVTLAGNMAAFGKALYKDGSAGGSLYLQSSIVSVNGGSGVVACDGLISSLGYNVSDGLCSMLTQTGDAQMTALNLGTLANHGGPTQTYVPALSSPAVDRVPPANCLITDQRGALRPAGALCDSGSVEMGGLLPLAYLPALVR